MFQNMCITKNGELSMKRPVNSFCIFSACVLLMVTVVYKQTSDDPNELTKTDDFLHWLLVELQIIQLQTANEISDKSYI